MKSHSRLTWPQPSHPWILGWGMITIFTFYVLLTNVTAAWLH